MLSRRRFGIALGSMVAGGLLSHRAFTQSPEASLLRNLKYEELGRLVRSHTGKVVLVDLWRHD